VTTSSGAVLPPSAVREALADPAAWLPAVPAAWLARCCEEAASTTAVLRAFPAIGRRLGRGPLPGCDPVGGYGWTVDDAGRTRLLLAASGSRDGDALATLLERLYRHGDAAERRGVLRALDVFPLGGRGLALLRDALRTNDARLIAAAVGGQYAAGVLPDADLAQAVLKCLFMGVPLAAVAAVPGRVSPELARMTADFARERVAAGRDVPDDAWLVLRCEPEAITAAGLPAELESPAGERRAAARRFFAAPLAVSPEGT
jgi:hypothetical protein